MISSPTPSPTPPGEAPGGPGACRVPQRVSPRKGRRFPAEVLTVDEVRSLYACLSPVTLTGMRNRAIVTLLYRAQLRVSEALALKPSDVDLEAGTVRVLHGKGNRSRTVGLDPGAVAVLRAWYAAREALEFDPGGPFVSTYRGKRLWGTQVRTMLARLGRQAGIEKRVHPHGLRHTGAAEMRAEGIDIGVISKQLGHASIAATSRYLDHIAPTAVIEAVHGREWEVQAVS